MTDEFFAPYRPPDDVRCQKIRRQQALGTKKKNARQLKTKKVIELKAELKLMNIGNVNHVAQVAA